jgi:hypothetical protein
MQTQNRQPIQNVELIEVKIKSTATTRFGFPINADLKGKKVSAIEVIAVADTTKTPLGDAVLNATAQKKGYLTLNANGKEKVKNLPLSSLIASNNNGLVKEFDNILIDFDKSYISFSETTGLVADEVVLLAVYFQD